MVILAKLECPQPALKKKNSLKRKCETKCSLGTALRSLGWIQSIKLLHYIWIYIYMFLLAWCNWTEHLAECVCEKSVIAFFFIWFRTFQFWNISKASAEPSTEALDTDAIRSKWHQAPSLHNKWGHFFNVALHPPRLCGLLVPGDFSAQKKAIS